MWRDRDAWQVPHDNRGWEARKHQGWLANPQKPGKGKEGFTNRCHRGYGQTSSPQNRHTLMSFETTQFVVPCYSSPGKPLHVAKLSFLCATPSSIFGTGLTYMTKRVCRLRFIWNTKNRTRKCLNHLIHIDIGECEEVKSLNCLGTSWLTRERTLGKMSYSPGCLLNRCFLLPTSQSPNSGWCLGTSLIIRKILSSSVLFSSPLPQLQLSLLCFFKFSLVLP